MSDFKTVCERLSNLDPNKRVNYVNGLVLGADEFVQEQLYHLEKHRLHNRLLHGYGTVCGLRVSVSDDGDGPQVTVAPGIAVDPKGHEIRVPADHCAKLNNWLDNHQTEVQERLIASPLVSPSGPLSLYLTLCYRECKTDEVPIPGGPCKTLEDSSVASRIQDAFELSFRLQPPDQTEHDRVVQLVDLLSGIGISNTSGGLSREEIEELVRGLIAAESLPLSPPLESRHMHPDDADELLCAAMRVWVTEVRPRLLASGKNCDSGPPDESCVLLAEMRFQLDDAFHIAGEIEVTEDNRPYLLHTRLLQEWLLCSRGVQTREYPPRSFATLSLNNPTTIRAWVHYPNLLDITVDAVSVEVEPPESPTPQLTDVSFISPDINVFDLILDAPLQDGDRVTVSFDPQQITLLDDPGRRLLDELEALDYRYLNHQEAVLRAYLTVVEPAVPELALGDLTDVEVGSPPADIGDVLTWSGSEWRPETPHEPDAAAGDFVGIPPTAGSPGVGPYAIVAAGMFMFNPGGSIEPIQDKDSFNELTAKPVDVGGEFLGDFLLQFEGYHSPDDLLRKRMYVVKGTVIDSGEQPTRIPGVFQFVRFQPSIDSPQDDEPEEPGIRVRVVNVEGVPNYGEGWGFMVEISAFGEPPLLGE